ncbi:type II secretion system F family protein [Nocardioides houyundeii]|uniref:type II secretion system F family protein n=1 Tax=Nocardioides houyundeii TaxID=2045452 RepID=UPI000C78E943|nr:type II secretion system F family protein [Nocardioides houyundeii]
MRLPRLLAAAGLVALIGLPLPAQAADDTTIAHVEPSADGVRVLVSVPPGADVDLSSVVVEIDGFPTTSTAEPAGGQKIERTTILAIDTSKSMAGPRFEAAKAAASAYLATVPADVKVGIVTFDGQVEEALLPTTDRAAATAVLPGLELSGGTRLYNGVLAATEMAGDEGQRSILVLSDGADTSKTKLTTVIRAIETSRALVDVVSLDQDGALSELTSLSEAGNGTVISAEPEALTAAFSAEAQVLARQILVSATLPTQVETRESNVVVTMRSGAQTLTAEAFVPIRDQGYRAPSSVRLPSQDQGLMVPEWGKWAALALVGVGLLGFLAALLSGFTKRELTAEERVNLYAAGAGATGTGAAPGRASGQTLAQAKGAAESVLKRNKSLEARIAKRLEAAGSDMRASEWLLTHLGVVLVAGLAGLLIGKGNFVVGLIFILLGVVLPWLWLGRKRKKRLKQFETLLPDTLQLMSGSLSAGLSLAQSIDTIVREGSEPIAGEFKRVLVETRLGVTIEDAMEGITERFDSKDFAWIVMAIRIQRQVGGNLGELLDTVAVTIREREYMRRQVRALAAEGKLSGYVLGGLPPGFMLFLVLTKPDYVGVLFDTPLGLAMLGGGLVLLSVGAFWMSRLVKVEV